MIFNKCKSYFFLWLILFISNYHKHSTYKFFSTLFNYNFDKNHWTLKITNLERLHAFWDAKKIFCWWKGFPDSVSLSVRLVRLVCTHYQLVKNISPLLVFNISTPFQNSFNTCIKCMALYFEIIVCQYIKAALVLMFER